MFISSFQMFLQLYRLTITFDVAPKQIKSYIVVGLADALRCVYSSLLLSLSFTRWCPQLLFQMKGSHATLIKHLIEGRKKKKREGADVCQRGKDNSERLRLLNETSQCCFLQREAPWTGAHVSKYSSALIQLMCLFRWEGFVKHCWKWFLIFPSVFGWLN